MFQSVVRHWVLMTTVVALGTLLGCTNTDGGVSGLGFGRAGGSAHSSPEAVFEVAKNAISAEDYQSFCECLAPETIDEMAGSLAMAGSMMQAFGGLTGSFSQDQDTDSSTTIEVTMKRHGIEGIAPPVNLGQSALNMTEMGNRMAAPIKNKPLFVAEMMDVMKGFRQVGEHDPADSVNGDLVDLNMNGDSASGFVQTAHGKEPIDFLKVAGGWKILLSMDPTVVR